MTDLLQQLDFHPVVKRWFASRFAAPSPPQLLGWPKIASGRHTLILAPTGSGKTLAAFLWCIDDLFRSGMNCDAKEFERNANGVHTLYISPLKALNNDIHNNLQEPLKGIRMEAEKSGAEAPHIRAAVRTGDTPSHVRQAMVKKPPHILITTPESLYLLLTSEKARLIFGNLKYIIVDEIHAISNNKRGVHLSLSMERLMTLVADEPTRIGLSATQKPLRRIAAFLGGLQFNPKTEKHEPRPVEIVDAGRRKDMDLKVISPVQDWGDLPDASVWPLVIDKLYHLINAHQTTLVFVNMRAQSERIARQLNEKHRAVTGDPDVELALAHHGSISREMRYEIEARLKKGKIPAVIATASLELGIDIGGIDLVVQLQSPASVSSGLQRVGRSGHLMHATSKGRIMPLFQADVDDCLAVARAMLKGDIEETAIPENALDVLAQQIIAEVSMRPWPRRELYRLVRGSYCYRLLSESAFDNVVDMLAGRFGAAELRALQPRITWDRVNDQLLPRRGSRLLAVMNGGTIADRGYYGVYLEGANKRLGEVEEEFVFESRVGDIFFLGNNEWRITEITRDRIMVTPRGSIKPRAPFWKAEPIYRDFSCSRKIGAFRRAILHASDPEAALCSDEQTLNNLLHYLQKQQKHTGRIPTDHDIVVEHFRDAADEPQIVIHAPFGGRVIGAWATALAAALEKQYAVQVQFTYDDDGMVFRILDAEEPPMDKLLAISFEDIEKLLYDAISQTPMFIVRFRHNATRALLLQRSRTDKRIPLWLQRLRAADLLQVVREFPDFPILLETYRDCLQDLFDVSSLKTVIDEIHSGETRIHIVHTPSPSPMTAGLLFRFLSEQMYEYDRHRTAGRAAEISSELLADILAREQIPTIVAKESAIQAEQRWQFLHPHTRAKDSEDCFQMIDMLAPIPTAEVERRCAAPPHEWLHSLQTDNRIVETKQGWVSQSTISVLKEENNSERLRRFLRVHGPTTLAHISEALGIHRAELTPLMDELVAEKTVVRGKLLLGVDEEQWCDRDNFALLYRQAVAVRRKAHDPGDGDAFLRFQLFWHHLAEPPESMADVVDQYAGLYFPLHFFERNVLASRMTADPGQMQHQFQELVAHGEVVPLGSKDQGGRYYVAYIPRGKGALFQSHEHLDGSIESLKDDVKRVAVFLKENGASPHRDICDACSLAPVQTDEALTTLARAGLASCDDLPSFLAILQNEATSAEKQIAGPRRRTRPQGRQAASRQKIRGRLQQRGGRWFPTTSFAVMGKTIAPGKRAELQARLLLHRYGVVVKEFYRRERGLEPWPRIFYALKKMEWSGEIRRGYFFTGLSGVQFASNAAVNLLEKIGQKGATRDGLLISTIDPALPFGGLLPWGLIDKSGRKVSVTRAAANHIFFCDAEPAAYLENYAMRIITLQKDARRLHALPEKIKGWLVLPPFLRPRKKIVISMIDDRNAAHSSLTDMFLEHRFEIDGDDLVLWPSNI